MGAFGVGYGFKNPAGQVAKMWRDILFTEKEFQGHFSNVVFAIENTAAATGSSASATSSANPPGGSPSRGGLTDLEVFQQEFDPSNVCKTSYR